MRSRGWHGLRLRRARYHKSWSVNAAHRIPGIIYTITMRAFTSPETFSSSFWPPKKLCHNLPRWIYPQNVQQHQVLNCTYQRPENQTPLSFASTPIIFISISTSFFMVLYSKDHLDQIHQTFEAMIYTRDELDWERQRGNMTDCMYDRNVWLQGLKCARHQHADIWHCTRWGAGISCKKYVWEREELLFIITQVWNSENLLRKVIYSTVKNGHIYLCENDDDTDSPTASSKPHDYMFPYMIHERQIRDPALSFIMAKLWLDVQSFFLLKSLHIEG